MAASPNPFSSGCEARVMLQGAMFLVSVLRTVPLAALLPGMESSWLARIGSLLTN